MRAPQSKEVPRWPVVRSRPVGIVATVGFMLYLVAAAGYPPLAASITILLGLPVAFLFLMFSNPKEHEGINWGTALAMPVCLALWPILLLALLAGKPWKDPRWTNRDKSLSTSAEFPSD